MTCHRVRAELTAYPRLAQVTLHSAPAQLHGGSRARLALHVYAPLWVLNRSQLPLQYQLKRRLLGPMATKGQRESRRARLGPISACTWACTPHTCACAMCKRVCIVQVKVRAAAASTAQRRSLAHARLQVEAQLAQPLGGGGRRRAARRGGGQSGVGQGGGRQGGDGGSGE